jgi:hypothetical protein
MNITGSWNNSTTKNTLHSLIESSRIFPGTTSYSIEGRALSLEEGESKTQAFHGQIYTFPMKHLGELPDAGRLLPCGYSVPISSSTHDTR